MWMLNVLILVQKTQWAQLWEELIQYKGRKTTLCRDSHVGVTLSQPLWGSVYYSWTRGLTFLTLKFLMSKNRKQYLPHSKRIKLDPVLIYLTQCLIRKRWVESRVKNDTETSRDHITEKTVKLFTETGNTGWILFVCSNDFHMCICGWRGKQLWIG